MTDLVPVRRALISLSDKSGLDELAAGLARHDVEIVSTGGTAAKLRELGAEVRDISDLTGFPEMMDGRVKTLHPKVHGGLLGVRDNPEHVAAMDEHDIAPIDLVVVNLYPFLKTVMSGADRDTIIENIDIGGPSMVRSAAKNHAHVAIVTDPADYAALLDQLDANGGTTLDFRKKLAAKAFALTAAYDSTISQWFAFADQGERWPGDLDPRQHIEDAAALRREPAPAGGALFPGRPGRARHRPGRTGSGQGAQLQQSQRRQCRARARRRVSRRPADRRHRQARQPVRRRHSRQLARRLERGARLRQRLGVRRNRRRQPPARRRHRRGDRRHFHRSRRRSRRRRRGARHLREKEEPAPAADRRAARSGARRPDHRGHRRRHPRPGPRQRHRHARPAQGRHQAPADRAGTRTTACSPGPSPSTSSRTPSSMPRTASPPASARAR